MALPVPSGKGARETKALPGRSPLTSCSSAFCPWDGSSSPSNVGGMLLLVLKVTVTLQKQRMAQRGPADEGTSSECGYSYKGDRNYVPNHNNVSKL